MFWSFVGSIARPTGLSDYYHGAPAYRRFSRFLLSAEMHQTDLTKRRLEFSVPVPNLLAIGWIEPDQFYRQGESSAEFIVKLRRILETRTPIFDLKVNATRGAYYCKFCNSGPLLCDRDEVGLVMSYCDYWIPDGEVWFVTPGLILHYIEEHNYAPPPQFINAVMKLDTNTIVLAERAQNEIWNSYWDRLGVTE